MNNPSISKEVKTWPDAESPTDDKPVSTHDHRDSVKNEFGEELGDGDPTDVSAMEAGMKAQGNMGAEAGRPRLDQTTSVRNVAAIPDGGSVAWLQVLGSWIMFFNTWGIINSYGAYQTYYESDLFKSSSPSTIAWIGSLQGFFVYAVGALVGPLYDSGYFKHLFATGSFLIVFGHMMLSLCKEYWQALLAQGVCIGLGLGFIFLPAVAILSTYFSKKLPFCVGIAATGSGLGGVLEPIILHKMMPSAGFPWTVRTLGFISLATLGIANLIMRTRVLPDKRRSLVDRTAFCDLPFLLWTVAGLLGNMGLLMPYYYIPGFVIADHITSVSLAFYLIPIINAGGIFGRILPPYIALKTGPFNVCIPATAIAAVAIYCLIPAHSLASVIVLSIIYGAASGAFLTVMPAMSVILTPDRAYIGTRLGMSVAFSSIGTLTGAPIGGAIIRSGGYSSVWVYGGSLFAGCSLLMLAARIAKVGWKPFVVF